MPERTCVACRAKREKEDLLRIVRRPDGALVVGAGSGRGAYVCRRGSCAAEAPGRLPRALRVTLGADDLARLRREIEKELG
ncbi:MAG TPA: YlxR family protein [Actinomycetota bacterium]|nr:YlxR family protein [Actinomycetota bacterium]